MPVARAAGVAWWRRGAGGHSPALAAVADGSAVVVHAAIWRRCPPGRTPFPHNSAASCLPHPCPAHLPALPLQAGIVAPNKHTSAGERMYKGHLLESETYIGGKVEAIESGGCRLGAGQW